MYFMLVGHTKFSPDWCFGLLKQRYRRTFVSSLQDIADVCDTSADVNHSQLIGTQDGKVVVPMYDWAGFLQQKFRKVPKIKAQHHFLFSADNPRSVTVQEFSDTEGAPFQHLADHTWCPSAEGLPPVVTPCGLSIERQQYLHDQIRDFCRPGTEDFAQSL